MLNKDETYFPTEDEIRERAYYIFLERKGAPGHEADDWIRAESELKLRVASNSSASRLANDAQIPLKPIRSKARADAGAARKTSVKRNGDSSGRR